MDGFRFVRRNDADPLIRSRPIHAEDLGDVDDGILRESAFIAADQNVSRGLRQAKV